MQNKFISSLNKIGINIGLIWFNLPVGIRVLITLFGLFLTWAGWFYGIKADSGLLDEKPIVEQCNPYTSDGGCVFNLKAENMVNFENESNGTSGIARIQTFVINGISIPGTFNLKASSNTKQFSPFPQLNSPYKICAHNKNILLRADLYDFKFDRKLGWFNEDKFKIDKWGPKDCAYTICKDNNGVEVYNVDYDVVFSITNTYTNSIRFAGSYKLNDLIYVYNGEIGQIFRSVESAVKEVSKIKEVFNFRDRDSEGNCKRLLFGDLSY